MSTKVLMSPYPKATRHSKRSVWLCLGENPHVASGYAPANSCTADVFFDSCAMAAVSRQSRSSIVARTRHAVADLLNTSGKTQFFRYRQTPAQETRFPIDTVQRHRFWADLRRVCDEFPPLFCVFQQIFRCVAGTTVQSSCLFTATVEEQLFNNSLRVFRGLVFVHSAFSLSHPDVGVVYPDSLVTVHICCMAQATRSQTDLHWCFGDISICESFSRIAVATDIRDSEWEQDQ